MSALANGSAIFANNHNVTNLGRQTSLVSWQCEEAPDLANLSIEDVDTYLFFLRKSHFSFVCQDGSIVQMSFKIHRGKIVQHRLCYLPCPVTFDPVELLQDNLYDIVERNMYSDDREIRRYRGCVRFDYDPSAANEDHPSSHLTFNYDDVRMPVGRSLDASTFLQFINSHFVSCRPDLIQLPLGFAADQTYDVLPNENRNVPHINWIAG